MIHISTSYEQKIFAPSTFYARAQENVRKVKESCKKCEVIYLGGRGGHGGIMNRSHHGDLDCSFEKFENYRLSPNQKEHPP